jgi:3-polyprenyl-4-hydroxybenzoate decarboxylase
VLRFQRTSRSDPSAPRDAPEITDKVIIDATKKLDYPYIPAYVSTWAPVAYPPEEIMKIVELRWKTEIEGKKLTEEQAKHLQQLKNRVKELESEWEEKRQSIKKMSEEEREKEKHRSYPRRT